MKERLRMRGRESERTNRWNTFAKHTRTHSEVRVFWIENGALWAEARTGPSADRCDVRSEDEVHIHITSHRRFVQRIRRNATKSKRLQCLADGRCATAIKPQRAKQSRSLCPCLTESEWAVALRTTCVSISIFFLFLFPCSRRWNA